MKKDNSNGVMYIPPEVENFSRWIGIMYQACMKLHFISQQYAFSTGYYRGILIKFYHTIEVLLNHGTFHL